MLSNLAAKNRALLPDPPKLAAIVGLAASLGWVYWPTFLELLERWGNDSRYSHGYLVPLFALFLLFWRSNLVPENGFHVSWWGLVVIVGALALHLIGTLYFYPYFSHFSILPAVAGCVVLLGGWQALRWAWPAVLFLAFMLPLPFFLETTLTLPLQQIGSAAGTYVLQTLGYSAFAEGSVIVMGSGIRLDVAEACSGLSMLMTFLAITVAFAILVDRPLADKAVILLSAVPIALLSNITRITVTGVLYNTTDSETARAFFHTWAGYFMMALGIALLLGELALLSWVFVTPPPQKLEAVGFDRWDGPLGGGKSKDKGARTPAQKDEPPPPGRLAENVKPAKVK